MTRIAVIDIETTGQSATRGDKIIEIGIVLIENNKIIGTYSQYVNPGKLIPPFITQLTSITNEDVLDQPTFKEVAPKVMEIIEGTVLVAHNVLFDIPFLRTELDYAGYSLGRKPMIDTVELSRILLPQAPGYKLTELSQYLHLEHSQPHRAISDAIVTAHLFLHLKDKLNRLPNQTIQQLEELFGGLKTDFATLRRMLQPKQKRQDLFYYNGFYLKRESDKTNTFHSINMGSYQEFIDAFYGHGKILSTIYNDYEERESQQKISETIFNQFRSKRHAMIEADTGSGKTMAYLIPVMYESIKYGDRVVISTSTTNLQTQLLHDEIRKLQPFLPKPIRVTIVKGKNHFLSLAKFYSYFNDKDANNEYDCILKGKILVWLTETKTGDIDDIALHRQDNPVFQNLLVGSELRENRSFKSICFYERMKQRAAESQLIITNHAVVALDLLKKEQMLPPYKKIIMDEAHHIETAVTKHMGETISYVQFAILYNQIEKQILSQSDLKLQHHLEELKYETDRLFRFLFTFVKENNRLKQQTNDVGRLQFMLEDYSMSLRDDLREIIDRLKAMCKVFHYELKDPTETFLSSELLQLEAYIQELREILLDPKDEDVSWIEIDKNGAENAVYLYREPINAGKTYVRALLEEKNTVVLISAAFTINHDFDYMRKKLELSDDTIDFYQFPYNYPYGENIQLMIPNDLPAIQYPSNDEFTYAITEALLSLATAKVHKKILVLFTSYDMLKKCYYLLKETELGSDYVMIGQGITSGSRNRLIKQFQSFERAILFGTNAFWEGIDLPGEDLTCLVIVKLPFQSPSQPLFKKKSVQAKLEGKSPFMEFSLPEAVLQFRQGFGRLIRKKTDHGIIFVMDDRLMTKSYGKYFLNSIPKVNIQYDSLNQLIDKANNWL
ncbi:ATP-dependent DNA helicase DinG [Gracilibacillus halotolerans]|uniref:3'-5' exonuclease DinG n=1 Tax=Gracilibacillus halotolerans TaxID=74386 RepID=A0A841RJF9_9BACI|nr:ATP-dependent DNA helicase DinG [Gracilibacillus halotolerans]MBB6511626.1 ATP-dependent DNA helicase DinG [Gracilibacillus halotolerans]